ncbi:muconolactone Delta-isomerase family protein [Dyadobacter sp. NIV53]|uniref:muconolactone Delta-isomerase family protein n=1 Tax=Dyadobacter sp. NIV53 TaxID=2861765 RepID=UPI001C85D46B|nr:muconolactone Delta-isomerase family protein [Dyadobacter sp. NIV53]
MSQYMVEIHLPAVMSEDFTAKIPAQRKKINEMMEQGRMMSYALSEDYSKLWCVVKAESEFEVMSLVSEFPLIDFMDPKISKLLFNNVVALRLPMFSLN